MVINDDVAVQDSLYTAGRRGTGATVFVEKIAGALAEEGADLAAVAAVAREVNERSRSFGVALSSCVVPAAGKPTFELGDAEVELGIGIHGEPGRTRAALTPARELAAFALDAIRADMPVDGDLLVMVNGMGGTPLIELYLHVQRGAEVPGGPRRARGQEPGGQLHHQPGDAGLLGDGLPAHRHAHPAVGRAGGHARPAVGTLGPSDSHPRSGSHHGR